MNKNCSWYAVGLLPIFLWILLGCGQPTPKEKKDSAWKNESYGELPQLEFGKQAQSIIEKELLLGCKLESNTTEGNGRSIIFSNYSNKGLVKRLYFLKEEQLVEVVQLIAPYSEVIDYQKDATEFSLTPKFEQWAIDMGFGLRRFRGKDYYLMNQEKKIDLSVLPAQLTLDGVIYAEMHFMRSK